MAALLYGGAVIAAASPTTSIFAPMSTPAHDVNDLSIFVLAITGFIYVGVSGLLVYALVRFRARPGDTTEPPQVFGSVQIELSWTIIPILIIVVLFLATARVLFSIQDAPKPATALDVIVVGHQFWWEFRYPQYDVVTANELHVPVSSKASRKADLHEAHVSRCDAQLLGAATGGQDGPATESRKRDVDRSSAVGIVCGTVRAVLRAGAREDAAAGLCGHAGGISTTGLQISSSTSRSYAPGNRR